MFSSIPPLLKASLFTGCGLNGFPHLYVSDTLQQPVGADNSTRLPEGVIQGIFDPIPAQPIDLRSGLRLIKADTGSHRNLHREIRSKNDRRHEMTKLTLLIICIALAGCMSAGPTLVSGSRTDYNVVLRQADDQQMLLNLVRLRYRDRAMFLEVSALNTQFSISNEVNANTVLGQGDSYLGFGGKVVAQETPTVSYTPLKGAEFVQRVLTPISLNTLYLLSTSGWSSDRLFRLLINQMNDVGNAQGANGPTPAQAPAYEEFKRLSFLLRQLSLDGLFTGAIYNNQPVLVFEPEALDYAQYQEFTRALGLNPAKLVFPVTEAARSTGNNSINLSFRSFAGVMYFLSQSVQVPEKDVVAGRVTVTRDAAGQPFDWQRVTEGILTIRSSAEPPDNASVAINYRNSWFYIDDSDLDSKSTFSLLGQVYQLEAGEAKSVVPVLTLPVGN
jgi:hypothetical protein